MWCISVTTSRQGCGTCWTGVVRKHEPWPVPASCCTPTKAWGQGGRGRPRHEHEHGGTHPQAVRRRRPPRRAVRSATRQRKLSSYVNTRSIFQWRVYHLSTRPSCAPCGSCGAGDHRGPLCHQPLVQQARVVRLVPNQPLRYRQQCPLGIIYVVYQLIRQTI